MTNAIEEAKAAFQMLQSREALALIANTLRNPDGAPLLAQPDWAEDVALMISADLVSHVAPLLAALSAPTVSGLTEEERAEGLGLAHQTPMQDVEIEYWLNQADNYAEVPMPCDDLRSLIARAISPTPSVSGLTEEERAEGRRLLAEAEAAYELGETPDRVRTAKDLQAWLFFNAKELLSLSPAPSIDWKRVAEVRERADELERLGHLAYHDWASEAHADRAFLLSLLPKQEG